MADIPARAKRAGTPVTVTETVDGTFDLVLCDAPCSGSGAWRRQPDAKWRLTPDRLADLQGLQAHILDKAASHVAPEGALAYATCSLLQSENEGAAQGFLDRNPGWREGVSKRFSPLAGGDGFFVTVFQRHADV